jgi:hypothetical protein
LAAGIALHYGLGFDPLPHLLVTAMLVDIPHLAF